MHAYMRMGRLLQHLERHGADACVVSVRRKLRVGRGGAQRGQIRRLLAQRGDDGRLVAAGQLHAHHLVLAVRRAHARHLQMLRPRPACQGPQRLR